MKIEIVCEECGKRIVTDDDTEIIVCPDCGNIVDENELLEILDED